MSISNKLISLPLATDISEWAGQENLKPDDLFKGVARECFNATMPVIKVNSDEELKKAIKYAVATKYSKPKDVNNLHDLIGEAMSCFQEKLADKLIRAAQSMGTHVPKMLSTNISDSALFFSPLPKLTTGITSSSVDSGRSITGSKDGTLVAAFGFLSATYQVGKSTPQSILEMIADEYPAIIKLLHELSGDKEMVKDLIQGAKTQLTMPPSNSISQFHKQNFIEFGGERITVSPLQAVNTTVALKRAIDGVFQDKGRVNLKRYVAGGAQSQNVSALNQDLGGAIPHIKAWVPDMRRKRNAFYFLFRHKRFILNREQKALIATLGWWLHRMESNQNNNLQARTTVDNIFTKLAQEWVEEFLLFGQEIDRLKDESALLKIKANIHPMIRRYLTANTRQEKSDVAEDLATELVALCSKQLQRNRFNHHIDAQGMNKMCDVFEKGDLLCHSL